MNWLSHRRTRHLAFFEGRGVSYRASDQTQDALQILKRCGLTCVRLRLFTSSAEQARANPYNYGNNLAYTVPLAMRVKPGRRHILVGRGISTPARHWPCGF